MHVFNVQCSLKCFVEALLHMVEKVKRPSFIRESV
jgi:hypothetical protein